MGEGLNLQNDQERTGTVTYSSIVFSSRDLHYDNEHDHWSCFGSEAMFITPSKRHFLAETVMNRMVAAISENHQT
jgi:hypothetical protein